MERINKNQKIIFSIIIFCSVVLRLINLDIPIGSEGHAMRMTFTCFPIVEYLKEGYTAFKYSIPILGPDWRIPYEFPVYQTIVYIFLKIMPFWSTETTARLVSIFIFYLSAWAYWKLCLHFFSVKSSLFICGFYLLNPFSIYWSRAVLIDYCSLLWAILYAYNLISWLKKNKMKNWVFALVFGGAGYLTKATTMIPIVIFLAVVILYLEIYENKIFNIKAIKTYIVSNSIRLLFLAGICVLPVVLGYEWIKYADIVKESNPYTAWLTSSMLKGFNYGLLEKKLNFNYWIPIIGRVLKFYYPSFSMGLIIVFWSNFGKGDKRTDKLRLYTLSSIIASIGTIFIIFNLYYVHDYYLIALSPFICFVGGIALEQLSKIKKKFFKLVFIVLIIISWFPSENYLNYLYDKDWILERKNYHSVGEELLAITDDDDRVIVTDNDWNPDILFYGERKGFTIREELDVDQSLIDMFKTNNFTYMVSRKGSKKICDVLKYWKGAYKYKTSIDKDNWQIVKLLNSEDEVISMLGSAYIIKNIGECIDSETPTSLCNTEEKHTMLYDLASAEKVKTIELDISALEAAEDILIYYKSGDEDFSNTKSEWISVIPGRNKYYLELTKDDYVNVDSIQVEFGEFGRYIYTINAIELYVQ